MDVITFPVFDLIAWRYFTSRRDTRDKYKNNPWAIRWPLACWKVKSKPLAPGRVAQSVTCLVTYAKLTADPGIPARSHTFVEIDHEIISTVILLPSAESFMKGCCQLQAKVCARLLVNCLFKLAQEKSVVR